MCRMGDWTPKPKAGVDVMGLDLSGEEGFVLSRIDGATSVQGLQHLTGLPESRLQQILDRLVETGAVQPQAVAGAARAAGPGPSLPDGLDDLDDLDDLPGDGMMTLEDQAPLCDTEQDGRDTLQDARDDEDEPRDDDEQEAGADADEEGEEGEDEEEYEGSATTWRQLFETELHPLPRDQRVEMARSAEGDRLCALCFDPDPGVIRAVLENLNTGLQHARLIANHHRNPVGLDALAHRAQFVRDAHVQRLLLRNTQTSDAILRRLLQGKPLIQLFQLTKNREMTERAKRNVRQAFRRAFQRADAEERVGLVFSSEGRCLNSLIGLSLDARTTALLCGRTYNSSLLIQNLARWPATPPNVLTHLFKQPAVRRAPHLKQVILQHPNCPSQLKRQGR